MILVLLTLVLLLGIGVTDVLAFGPLVLLDSLHLPQWLSWAGIVTLVAWFVGSD